MAVKYLYPFWGSESLSPQAFLNKVEEHAFDGIEINIPKDKSFIESFTALIEKKKNSDTSFVFVAQQVLGNQKETTEQYLERVLDRLKTIAAFSPDFINSHTGKDYYSFSDNCKIIDAIEEFSVRNGIPIYHEIHRGRFTFHSEGTLRYLDMFPQIRFVADFSHWCVVSESMLQDQEEVIKKITPNIAHIHARVGSEQASQVNNPFAPEWIYHLERYTSWWQDIIRHHDKKVLTITSEFGPIPYMPTAPFTNKVLADQESLNVEIRKHLKTNIK